MRSSLLATIYVFAVTYSQAPRAIYHLENARHSKKHQSLRYIKRAYKTTLEVQNVQDVQLSHGQESLF